MVDSIATKAEFDRAKELLAQAQQEDRKGNTDKAEELEGDAATLANALGYQGGKNQFSAKESPMLYRQFEKGREGKEMINQSAEKNIEDSTYKEVSNDLRRLSKTLKNDDKAIKAGELADRIAKYSQDHPAPKALQAQILHYREKRQELTVNLVKQAAKGEELGI